MEKLAFREELEQKSLEGQIPKRMAIRRVTNIDGLSRESGRPASQIRPALEAMIVRGAVKRLRPVWINGRTRPKTNEPKTMIARASERSA